MDYKRSEKYHSTKFSPEVWNLKKLKDLALLITDRIDVKQISLEDYVSTENLLPNKGGKEKAIKIPPYGNVTRFEKGDILLSNIRPYFKKIWLATNNGGCSNDVLVIRPKNEISNSYLYYCLQQDVFFDYVTLSSKGTKMPRGDKDAILNFEFPIPPLNEQAAIAKILSDLDSKIELNQKMNKTLEAIAQAIFKHWFIDFEFPNEEGKPYKSSGGEMVDSELGKIPEGWTISIIKDELVTVLGGTPSTDNANYWTNGTIPWINSGKINEFRIIEPTTYITEIALKKSATKLMPKGTVVIAITGATLGQVSRLEIDTCANQSVVGIIPNSKLPSEYIYFTILKNIDVIIQNQTGGAQQHINKGNIDRLRFLVPPKSITERFSDVVKPFFEDISLRCFERLGLSKIRDILLPKLMSGKIRVPLEGNDVKKDD